MQNGGRPRRGGCGAERRIGDELGRSRAKSTKRNNISGVGMVLLDWRCQALRQRGNQATRQPGNEATRPPGREATKQQGTGNRKTERGSGGARDREWLGGLAMRLVFHRSSRRQPQRRGAAEIRRDWRIWAEKGRHGGGAPLPVILLVANDLRHKRPHGGVPRRWNMRPHAGGEDTRAMRGWTFPWYVGLPNRCLSLFNGMGWRIFSPFPFSTI